jgi:hypothetical protein
MNLTEGKVETWISWMVRFEVQSVGIGAARV